MISSSKRLVENAHLLQEKCRLWPVLTTTQEFII